MTNRQKQFYRLGQVYGYICKTYPEWDTPEHRKAAMLQPLQYTLIAVFAAVKASKIRSDDKYIYPRMWSVSPELMTTPQPSDFVDMRQFANGEINYGAHTHAALIKSTGLTQQQIGERLGVNGLTVSRWYRGVTPLPEWARYEIEEIILDAE